MEEDVGGVRLPLYASSIHVAFHVSAELVEMALAPTGLADAEAARHWVDVSPVRDGSDSAQDLVSDIRKL